MTPITDCTTEVAQPPAAEARAITARQGSELAEMLRSRGWVARAGWRVVTDGPGGSNAEWLVRYEAPDANQVDRKDFRS